MNIKLFKDDLDFALEEYLASKQSRKNIDIVKLMKQNNRPKI